jgi:hypothetical protein
VHANAKVHCHSGVAWCDARWCACWVCVGVVETGSSIAATTFVFCCLIAIDKHCLCFTDAADTASDVAAADDADVAAAADAADDAAAWVLVVGEPIHVCLMYV